MVFSFADSSYVSLFVFDKSNCDSLLLFVLRIAPLGLHKLRGTLESEYVRIFSKSMILPELFDR
jgi:hypothetical protein